MKTNEKTFEKSLEKLELIIEELESGSPDLDKMLKLFEDGMELTKYCRGQLEKVENRISTIVKDGDKIIEQQGMDPA